MCQRGVTVRPSTDCYNADKPSSKSGNMGEDREQNPQAEQRGQDSSPEQNLAEEQAVPARTGDENRADSPTQRSRENAAPLPPSDWAPDLGEKPMGPAPKSDFTKGGLWLEDWQNENFDKGISGPPKWVWVIIGMLTGIFSFLFVLIACARKSSVERAGAFRSAAIGVLAGVVVQLIVMFAMADPYVQMALQYSSSASTSSSGGVF